MMMKKILFFALIFLGLNTLFCEDAFVGEYKGLIKNKKGYPFDSNPEMCAQISKHADGYKLRILPELLKRSDEFAQAVSLKDSDGKIEVKDLGKWKLCGEISNGKISLKGTDGKKEFEIVLDKFERKSPTLAMPAPANAVVLFNGKNTDLWKTQKGENCAWKLCSENAMQVAKNEAEPKKNQTIYSEKSFTNFKLHLEFMLPDMYRQSEQGRANSGVFIGPYEVQILDSFNCEGKWNECGSIYRIFPPICNAVLPPLKWQTYDIEFFAPTFDDKGALKTLPRISVYLNGVLVQNKMEIPHGTSVPQPKRAAFKHPKPPYKLSLQDHNNPIKFRNIWVEEL